MAASRITSESPRVVSINAGQQFRPAAPWPGAAWGTEERLLATAWSPEIADLPGGRNTLPPMKLNDAARQLIGSNPATLVTNNRDGSSQVSVVWIVVQRTAEGDDELVTAHLEDYLKLRNIRRDPRVSVTVVSTDRSGPFTPWLSVKGTARVVEGGAPELLVELNTRLFGPGAGFPPPDAPPGYLTRITIDKVGGVGPWAS